MPYFQQRIQLPLIKLKLIHIELDMENDLRLYERGKIDEDETSAHFIQLYHHYLIHHRFAVVFFVYIP